MTHKEKVRQMTIGKSTIANFVFLMTVGVLFAWSLVFGVLNPTVFRLDYMVGLGKVVGIVGVIGLIFSSKHAMWISLGLFGAFSLFIASGFLLTPEYPNIANQAAELLANTISFIGAQRPHTDLYEMVAVWAVCIGISLFVVIFSYFRFRFLVLFIASAITFGVSMTSYYFSYTRAFYVFIFSILVLLIRHLHQKSADIGVDSTPFTKYILALTAISFLIASIIPAPPAGFAEGVIQNTIQRPFNFINDTLANLTQSSEFSLRQIGFGGSGRLGGDIAPNDSLFMRIRTDKRGRIYLTGAVMDTYTGYSWENHFSDERSIDFNVFDQNLELFEEFLIWDLVQFTSLTDVPVERFVLLDADDDYFDHWTYVGPAARVFRDEIADRTIWTTSEPEPTPWNINFNLYYERDWNSVYIDVLDLRPRSAFHSGIVLEIDAQNRDDVSFLRDRDGRLLATRRMPVGTHYRVAFLEQEHVGFYLLAEGASQTRLDLSYRGILNDMSELAKAFRVAHGYDLFTMPLQYNGVTISAENLIDDYLIPRANRIHETYIALPDEFPERVGELAYEVTEGAATDYERMRMLEAYLNENFAYTLTPGWAPHDRDFVDHFLFDIREGYCVHFATAFVTMARSLGMPARYVEGFLVHTGLGIERDEEGFIDVLNNMAHAWAEVYFEGVGWVRFEPTPPSGLPQSPAASAVDANEDEETDTALTDGQGSDHRYYDVDLGEDYIGDQGSARGVEQEVAFGWHWILIGVGAFLVLVIARIVFVHLKRKQAKGKDNNEAIIHSFGVMLSYFKVLKFEMQDKETATQFARRICGESFDGKHVFLDGGHALFDDEYVQHLFKRSVDIFAKARYSNLPMSDEEHQAVEKVLWILDDRLKHDKGKWKYLYSYYVWIRH